MHRTRPGFTLIEMLVAMALTVFIMVIISQAFVAGLDTFRGLKAIGDMQSNLRSAQLRLRSDLAEDHFEGRLKLSDLKWLGTTAGTPAATADRPREGYFYIRQGNVGPTVAAGLSTGEGVDADGLPSIRSVDHVLAFTVKLRGNKRENVLMSKDVPLYPIGPPPPNPPQAGPRMHWSPLSKVDTNFWFQPRDGLFNPGGPIHPPTPQTETPDPTLMPPNGTDTFASQWAEVAYFLVQTGTAEEADNPNSTLFNATPLFGLYRAQYLLLPRTELANKSDLDKTGFDQDTIGTTQNDYLLGTVTAGYSYYAGISCQLGPLQDNQGRNFRQLLFKTPADVGDGTIVGVTTQGMRNRVLPFHQVALPLTKNTIDTGTDSVTGFPLFPGARSGNVSLPRSTTLVASNVVSFNVQVLYAGGTEFVDLNPWQVTPNPNPSYVRLFDSTLFNAGQAFTNQTPPWTSANGSAITTIVGLRITLRVHDPNTGFTRQMSFVQDM